MRQLAIGIIVLLLAGSLAWFVAIGLLEGAKRDHARRALSALTLVLVVYGDEHGRYPPDLKTLEAADPNLGTEAWLTDPWRPGEPIRPEFLRVDPSAAEPQPILRWRRPDGVALIGTSDGRVEERAAAVEPGP